MSTILGRPITMGGSGKLPDIFGDGSDGDLVIKAGETVTLPVAVPHQSVIEMQYKSITIEAGGTLTTADYNAGLVLRCQGDCTIHGTIDQSGKAPKTNPDSTYQYPEELVCGAGGAGGNNTHFQDAIAYGGAGMQARPYGGGYGGGGAGAWGYIADKRSPPAAGGSASTITIDTPDDQMFLGGAGGRGRNNGTPGSNGGGGGGDGGSDDGTAYVGGQGGTGPGGNGKDGKIIFKGSGGGGGAGNTGGGVVLLYIGGDFLLDGDVRCNGLDGGNGGAGPSVSAKAPDGGGGGGGSIYVVHNGTQTVTGNLNVNGGTGGNAGSIGTTTIKQYEKGMTA